VKGSFRKILPVVFSLLLVGSTAACLPDVQRSQRDGVADPGAAVPSSGGAFDWEMSKGETIHVMFNQHPYAEAIIERLPEFEKKTGIRVRYSVTPESNYFDKLTVSLNARNGRPDVFMTGSYQLWEFLFSGYVQELDPFIRDKGKTSPDYDPEDFFEGVLNGNRWNMKVGRPVGTGPLWAVPLGFEVNVLMYNRRALDKVGADPPKTFDELIETASKLNGWNGEGSYGIAVRGTRSWATIHPGYMTAYSMAGARDFQAENGRLVSRVNSPQAVEITEKFARLVREAGPKDWTNYTWYQVSTDLGAGKAAMAYDADILGFFQNVEGASKEAGNIGWAPPPLPREGAELGSNMWIWSLAMNRYSQNKDAAWLFMQYFTGKEHIRWGATEANVVNPPRRSVWEDSKFRERIKRMEGYRETFESVIDHSTIKFTPQPEFFNITTEWAAALQDIVIGSSGAGERLNQLAQDADVRIKRMMDRIE
jgi:multiple sugar transport system substrate-binding protein